MKKVGDILKESREQQKYSIDDISRLTKISPDFIRYLEEGSYHMLPDEVYIKGFIKSYARVLGLDVKQVIPFYRREQSNTVKNKLPPQEPKRFIVNITPTKVITYVAALAVTGFVIFLFIQYRMFANAPVLVIDAPSTDITTTNSSVTVVGSTDPDVTVTVNGEEVDVLQDGDFSVVFNLNEGLNRIRIVAVTRLGNKTVVERVVEREVP